jgi:hypothetical protein
MEYMSRRRGGSGTVVFVKDIVLRICGSIDCVSERRAPSIWASTLDELELCRLNADVKAAKSDAL